MRKKILITTGIFPPEIGGPSTYAKTIAQRLSQKYEVIVITYSSSWGDKEDKNRPFKVVRVWKKNLKFLRHLMFLAKTIISAKGVDAIFSLNAVSAGYPALIASKLFKKKLFIKIVGDYSWETAINSGKTSLLINDFQKFKRKGKTARLHKVQVKVCKGAQSVIVPSAYLKEIVKGWGVADSKIKVVYNSVDFKPSGLSKEEARKQLGITGNVILSFGRLVPWKGFRMLIKILPKLFDINQFFRLVIAGDGPDRENLEAMVKNMSLDKKVYFLGRKTPEELAVVFAASDMFVLNTGYEGFSHQLLEAMVAGIPIITTAVGGNREIIHQGENGFMVKYNDEFNLIEAIRTLWSMPELRQRFVEGGKKTAEFFNIEKMIKETISILNSNLQ